MSQDWRHFGPDPLRPPLRAALAVFAREGYHGASIRSIADAAGLSVPGLYHHHRSKQAILDAIISAVMSELLAHAHMADAASDGTPAGRFDNIVECLARFHMERRDHAFVASTEMRSMEPDVRARTVASRDEQQAMIEDAIARGVAEGTFSCPHPDDAARAISSLCVSISTWYRPDGPYPTDAVVSRYLGYSRAIAGATVAGCTRSTPR